MTSLTITRGLPASGKTTWARTQAAWRVNRDDLRAMAVATWDFSPEAEERITIAQYAMVRALLSSGQSVIVDDTNITRLRWSPLEAIARECGAEFIIMDFSEVSLEICLERNAARATSVPESVIHRMAVKLDEEKKNSL